MAFKQAILEKTPSVFVQLKGTCSKVHYSSVLCYSMLWYYKLMILYHIVQKIVTCIVTYIVVHYELMKYCVNNLNRIGNPLSVSVNALADGWLHGREEMLALEDAGVMQNYSISVTEAERSNNLGAFENSESEIFTFTTVHFHLIVLTTSLDYQNIISYQKDSNHKTTLYFTLNFSTCQYMAVHNAFQSAVLQKETAVLRSQCTKLQVLTLSEHVLIVKPS
jgi:hypothetical protein